MPKSRQLDLIGNPLRMANFVCEVSITEAALSRALWPNEANSGALLDFFGVVRGLEDGRLI